MLLLKLLLNNVICPKFFPKKLQRAFQPVHTSNHPRDNVNVDLIGPMPNIKHVLVVQDMFTWFPAAEIVKYNSAGPVMKALDDIYTNFGTPTTHRTSNGPPFQLTAV